MEIPPEVVQAAPGAIGSGIALRWLEGTWGLKLSTWVGGSAISYYVGPWIAWMMDITHAGAISFIGLAVGLFVMICAGKVYEMIKAANVSEAWTVILEAVKKRIGG